MRSDHFRFRFGWVTAIALMEAVGSLTAQDSPRFSSVQVLAEGDVSLRLAAAVGHPCRIDVSANLADWTALVTVAGSSSVEHLDSAGPYFDVRFYRAEQLADASAFLGDHLATSAGDAVMRPLDHASLVLQWNGQTVYVDPTTAAGPFSSLPKADLILITHSHGDHFDTGTLTTLAKDGTRIVAPAAVQASLPAALKPLTTVLANGGQTAALGLAIEAVPAYNANHPKGAGNGYVVNLGGKRLYVSGDTGDTPETRALADIDLAFLCMNQPYTLTIAQAVSVVRQFRPKIVYPYHYRNQNGTLADVNAFRRQVGTDLGIEVRLRKWY